MDAGTESVGCLPEVTLETISKVRARLEEMRGDLYQSIASSDVDVVLEASLPPHSWYIACSVDYYRALRLSIRTVFDSDAEAPSIAYNRLYGVEIVSDTSLPPESWQVRCDTVCYEEVQHIRRGSEKP